MISKATIYNIARFFFPAWAIAIVAVSLTPGAGIESLSFGDQSFRIDYPLHATAFFILPVSAWMAYGYTKRALRHPGYRKAVLLSLILAIASEFLQIPVPGRAFNVMDIVSNLLGVGGGVAAVSVFTRLWQVGNTGQGR
ncbi:MAG: VanZ family protein [Bacteroidales bacterium]